MKPTLTTDELRQIVDSHEKGYGMSVPINYGYLAARELLANREAQPVAWASTASLKRGDIREVWPNGEQYKAGKLCITALYTAPPAPAVNSAPDFEAWFNSPEAGLRVVNFHIQHELQLKAWNACRAAMLAQPVSQGCKLPDGWKLVPIDATRAMIDAAQRVEEDGYDAMHKAMLAAAPEGGNYA